MSGGAQEAVTSLIDRWRDFAVARGTAPEQLDRLERELRRQTTALCAAGLAPDEAFLVALKRLAADDESTRAFARAYADEQWDRPATAHTEKPAAPRVATEFWVMLGCAVAAALAVKVPVLFGYTLDGDTGDFYALNLSFFVLPFLATYFIWKRRPAARVIGVLATIFVALAAIVNAYPFESGGSTEILAAIHLPIALWLVVGVAHAGGDWTADRRRMDYVRFTGEWLVVYALIALGGGVLAALTIGAFEAIGLDASTFVGEWVLPCGAMGAVVVGAWLVETRRGLVGGMAPMLARVFTPLFALVLVALLVGVVWTRGAIDMQREVLILFDLLLVVVLALVLYAVSARDRFAAPGVFDGIQLALVGCALVVDVVALVNIAVRLSEFGLSPNRTTALGLNLILLVNLAWSAVLLVGFLRAKRGFEPIERWQMRYLPVYAVWAAIVVIVFPPLFGFA